MALNEDLPVPGARAGNAAAWDALFRRFQLPLYVFAMELIRDEQAALDVVQETFIAAARHLRQLREDGRFGSWLFGIAHQKCIQRWRRVAAQPVFEPVTEDLEVWNSPADFLIRAEDEDRLHAALGTLPDEQRSVVLLHYLEEFSLQEIAQVLVIPIGTVKSRLFQARARMREYLSAESPPSR